MRGNRRRIFACSVLRCLSVFSWREPISFLFSVFSWRFFGEGGIRLFSFEGGLKFCGVLGKGKPSHGRPASLTVSLEWDGIKPELAGFLQPCAAFFGNAVTLKAASEFVRNGAFEPARRNQWFEIGFAEMFAVFQSKGVLQIFPRRRIGCNRKHPGDLPGDLHGDLHGYLRSDLRGRVRCWNREEGYRDGACGFIDFGARHTCVGDDFENFQGAASPCFYDAAAVEDIGDGWVPRLGFVRQVEGLRGQPKVQGASRGDFKPVRVYRNAGTSAADAVIAVAKGVGEGFTQGNEGVFRDVNTLHAVFWNVSGYGYVIVQEAFGVLQQSEQVSAKLAVVEELAFILKSAIESKVAQTL